MLIVSGNGVSWRCWRAGNKGFALAPVRGRWPLGIDKTMQVKRRWDHRSLTQHDVNLGAMMRLMVEQVTDGHRCLLDTIFALAVRVHERPFQEIDIQLPEERFDKSILFHPGRPQSSEVIEEDCIQRRRYPPAPPKSRHPDLITEQDVIQQSVNTAERALAPFLIFSVVEFCAFLVKTLVRDPVVTGKHPKMVEQIHLYG